MLAGAVKSMLQDQAGLEPDSARRDKMIAGVSGQRSPAMASAALEQRKRETDFIMEGLLREYYSNSAEPLADKV